MNGRLLWFVPPVLLVAGIVAFVLIARPLDGLTGKAPPVEELKVDTVRLTPYLISATVQADGSQPVRIAQVQVDGAYRRFTSDPPGPIARLASARIDIPYPWIEGEAHHLVFVTSTGASFDHTIEVATADLRTDRAGLPALLFVGLLLGVAPVAAGMLAFPAIRTLQGPAMTFVIAMTLGLLLYLLIDTLQEGLELAEGAIDRLRARTVVWVAAIVTGLVLLAIGRRNGKAPEGVALAVFIALGIGLHNLGEGLAVGASMATGAAALATFLVVGFTIHNVSEGFAIAAPLAQARSPLLLLAGLALLAGLPAILGVVLGASAVAPYWSALCFGIGAGAIAQVVIELGAYLARREGAASLIGLPSFGGVVAGLAIMYTTALLV